jgi:phosphosulfolactate phosphohydrolase-like enzyme
MLKTILVQILLVIMLMAASPFYAQAIEKMSATDLQAVCQAFADKNESVASDKNKSFCAMYLKGYLAGEKLHRAEKMPAESFRKKALESRAGGLLEKYQLANDVSYCIPKSTTIEDIALLINQQKLASDASAESLIQSVLQQNFQCAK